MEALIRDALAQAALLMSSAWCLLLAIWSAWSAHALVIHIEPVTMLTPLLSDGTAFKKTLKHCLMDKRLRPLVWALASIPDTLSLDFWLADILQNSAMDEVNELISGLDETEIRILFQWPSVVAGCISSLVTRFDSNSSFFDEIANPLEYLTSIKLNNLQASHALGFFNRAMRERSPRIRWNSLLSKNSMSNSFGLRYVLQAHWPCFNSVLFEKSTPESVLSLIVDAIMSENAFSTVGSPTILQQNVMRTISLLSLKSHKEASASNYGIWERIRIVLASLAEKDAFVHRLASMSNMFAFKPPVSLNGPPSPSEFISHLVEAMDLLAFESQLNVPAGWFISVIGLFKDFVEKNPRICRASLLEPFKHLLQVTMEHSPTVENLWWISHAFHGHEQFLPIVEGWLVKQLENDERLVKAVESHYPHYKVLRKYLPECPLETKWKELMRRMRDRFRRASDRSATLKISKHFGAGANLYQVFLLLSDLEAATICMPPKITFQTGVDRATNTMIEPFEWTESSRFPNQAYIPSLLKQSLQWLLESRVCFRVVCMESDRPIVVPSPKFPVYLWRFVGILMGWAVIYGVSLPFLIDARYWRLIFDAEHAHSEDLLRLVQPEKGESFQTLTAYYLARKALERFKDITSGHASSEEPASDIIDADMLAQSRNFLCETVSKFRCGLDLTFAHTRFLPFELYTVIFGIQGQGSAFRRRW